MSVDLGVPWFSVQELNSTMRVVRPAYRFLKRKIRWSGIPISQNFPQFAVIHTVKGFGIVNKAEIDVFLELSCFFHDPADVAVRQEQMLL